MVSVGDTLPFPKVADFLASHSLYEGLPRLNTHRTISVPGCCVVVAIARNSPSTSNVSCRNIDDDESGEGEPFQLRKLENRSFWKNEEVTNEGLKVGCLLEYRVVRRRCELGEGDEEQFIFHRIAGTKLQDVDKILLDLEDDESVHEGLKEALEYYNQKDAMTTLLYIINLINDVIKRLREEIPKCSKSKDLVRIPLQLTCLIFGHCVHIQEALKGFNLKDLDKILLDLTNCTIAHYKHLEERRKCFKLEYVDNIPLDLINLIEAHYERVKEAIVCFHLEYEYRTQVDFLKLTFAHFKRLKEALECLIPKVFLSHSKFPELQAYSACTRLFFTGIRAGTINNERVTLETMSGERLDMPLNCRESLVLSTGPVHLQLKRPWVVADNNVGGVAVLKYEDGKTTCEGLILKYKPYVLSRDEEPVKIQNASDEMILIHHVFELEPDKIRWKVLFDTANEVCTGISRELLEELNLQADPNKKKKAKVIGGEPREFQTIQIVLVIRGHRFSVCGLVDAVAEDTNLLMGTDIIQPLYDLGYTIGN